MLHHLLGRPARRPLSRPAGYRPRLEALEDRTVPSTTATSLFLVAPPTAYAGQPTQVTVIPLNASNYMVPDFTGTVALSGNAGDTLPAPHAFQASDRGFYTFTLTPAQTGSDKITATDAADGLSGSVTLNVVAAPTTAHFFLVPLSDAVAGAPARVGVVALDASDHLVRNYTGTVTLTSTGTGDTPATQQYQFQAGDGGIHVFTLTPGTVGSDVVTATDTSGVTGQVTLNVTAPQVATHFFLTVPHTANAGEPTPVTVIALDATDHLVRNYTGTVTLTSTGTGDVLPTAYQFQAGDGGIHTFTVTPGSAGSDVITATDTSGVTGQVTLNVAAPQVATHFYLVAVPGSWDERPGAFAGQPTHVAVVALDASDHLVRNYTGTVTLTSTGTGDTPATQQYQFQAGDGGIHVFTLTPGTVGSDVVTATDTSGVTGQVTLNVAAAPVATHFFLVVPHNVPVGTPVPVAVVALDASDRIVTNYTGTVTLTSSDPGATLPGPTQFQASDRGIHRFTVTFSAAGNPTLTATDSANNLSATVTVPVGQGSGPWWWA